jgi:hypothetical protein
MAETRKLCSILSALSAQWSGTSFVILVGFAIWIPLFVSTDPFLVLTPWNANRTLDAFKGTHNDPFWEPAGAVLATRQPIVGSI